jgi:hypothetical protein
MKKLILAAALMSAFGAAQALEVGVFGGLDLNDRAHDVGVSVGQKFGAFSVTASAERLQQEKVTVQDRYTLLAGYDLLSAGPLTLTGKVGVARLENKAEVSGYSGVVGVGATFALNKTFALTADYRYLEPQQRVVDSRGGNVTVGVKASF